MHALSYSEFFIKVLGLLCFLGGGGQFEGLNKIDYLDNGFPVAAKGEKVTSNNSSIPPMFSTKYLNFKQKIFKACFRTSSKYAFPAAIRFSCFSTADLMVGSTSSMSIYKGYSTDILVITLCGHIIVNVNLQGNPTDIIMMWTQHYEAQNEIYCTKIKYTVV